ncbi:DUF1631 family protein [Polaromonas sp. A23]|uniref:DUF1631 family protein n=1 Tax=Polaromonas sp. A23 TaxID=1944133 RepID=UPI0009842ABB|nr:DUF1631 family protein [Polaromonas sp. A23]OOG46561.1 hypothetical protein B0B52_02690 [Polaromonas sp. A23]
MALQADVFQRCLQEAAKAGKPALERCIDHAVSALQVAETQSMKAVERDELGQAWRELVRLKGSWCQQYAADLSQAFNAAASATPKVKVMSTSRPAALALAGADLFSLVDDTQVEAGIESSRLMQQVAPVVEQVLAELDGLMSSAQGLVNVSPEANPVRPEVYVQALRALLAATPAAPGVGALWVKHLAEPLGRELKRVYEQLVNMLELAQVRAASYRVLQTPAGNERKPTQASAAMGRPASGGPGETGDGAPTGPGGYVSDEPLPRTPSQYADLSNYEIKDALFQDFLFRGGSNANHGLAPSYYATIEEELIALKATPDSAQAPLQAGEHQESGDADHSYHGTRSDPRRHTLPATDAWEEPDTWENGPGSGGPSRIVDVLSQLSSQVWGVYGRARERALVRTQLKKDATHVGQVLGMEVVKKLVNQVAQDPRLLVPVREAIVALEPSLLRLAMVDSRFFSEENHPGRRLMERVAQRSFKYNDERSPEFDIFFHSVTEAFNTLNALEIEDARPFGAALTDLQNLWDEQDQHEQAQRSNIRQTMQFAEERQAQADQIAFDMSLRADLDNVPGVVLDFLFGPWALVMAHARLTDTARQIDPEGYGSLVTDLLWSVKREVTLKRPGKLITMIPGLLGKLHEGLASLGLDPRETEAFFSAIEKLHRPVLKLRRVRSRRDAVESDQAPLEVELAEPETPDLSDILPATPEQRKAKAAGQPWLAPQELDHAGFEDTMPSGPAELSPTPDDEQATTISGDEDDEDEQTRAAGDEQRKPEDILMDLREGSWVDLYSKRRWLRAQLIWASNRGTLFMFVSHGGQPHSMTKRSCERLIKDNLLRPVETHGVVAHALDNLVREAAPADAEGSAA